MASSAGSKPPPQCIACNKTPCNIQVCSRCKSARYCSGKCQKADWPTHKILCAGFAALEDASRPSENHIKVIYFPLDSKKPQIVWLGSEIVDDEILDDKKDSDDKETVDDNKRFEDGEDFHYDEEGTKFRKYQIPDMKAIMGPESYPEHRSMKDKSALCGDLEDTIFFCIRDGFLTDGSKRNKSVQAVLVLKPWLGHHSWFGPIIIYVKKGRGVDPAMCRDIDMNDFRYVADMLHSYNSTSLAELEWAKKYSSKVSYSAFRAANPTYKSQEVATVKGVRINCHRDMKQFPRPYFEGILVPITDPIFVAHDTSDIANRIGHPILARQNDPYLGQAGKTEDTVNQEATFLFLNCDPKDDKWGSAPMKWQGHVGSITVIRQDRKDLSPFLLEAISNYCRYEILPILLKCSESQDSEHPFSKDTALSMICRPTFDTYWPKFCDKKISEGIPRSWLPVNDSTDD